MFSGSEVNRIAIVGAPGSGKSTIARKLGELTGLPVYHMDHIHWKPGWVARDRSEKIEMALGILAQEQWIFEGGFSEIHSERLSRADMLIWLDLPFWLRVWRVIKRTVRWFGQSRPDMQIECKEGLNPEMLKFFKYIWDTRHSARAKIAASVNPAPHGLILVHLTSPNQVHKFLRKAPE